MIRISRDTDRLRVCVTRVLLVALLLLPGALSAATRTVTTLADSGAGSLRGTINASADGDTIVFASVVRGTIRLTSGELVIDKRLSIIGPGAAALAISGNNSSRNFNIRPNGNVDIYGLTIAEGLALGANGIGPQQSGKDGFGGGIFNEGRLKLFDCMIATNRAQGGRGGDGQFGGPSVTPGNGGLSRGGAIFDVAA